jgi:hypothetical protein
MRFAQFGVEGHFDLRLTYYKNKRTVSNVRYIRLPNKNHFLISKTYTKQSRMLNIKRADFYWIYRFIGEEPAKCRGNIKKFLVKNFY